MVTSNKSLPEAPNSTEEPFVMNDFIVGNESDSDEDGNIPPNDYQPLPLSPPDDFNVECSDSEDDSVNAPQDLPPVDRYETSLVQEVWSAPTHSVVDIKMDSEKVDEVKQAMANITLPSCSIPEWANNVPEEQWKEHLINRLQYLQNKLK